MQTSDTVWFAMIPIRIDSKERLLRYRDRCLITVTVTALQDGFSFAYNKAVFNVDDKSFLPSMVNWSELPMELSKTEKLKVNLERDKKLVFYLYLDTPTPRPDQKIILDLSNAITHKNLPGIPIIQFEKRRWSFFYG